MTKWLKDNLYPQGAVLVPANFEMLPRPLVVVYHPNLDFVKNKAESKRIRKSLFELREELEDKINIAVAPYYPELEEKKEEDHYNGKNLMFPIEHEFDVDKTKPFSVVYIWNNKHKVYDGVWEPRNEEFKKFVKYFLGIQKSTSDASRKKMKLEAAQKAAEEAAQRVADAEKDSENVKDEL